MKLPAAIALSTALICTTALCLYDHRAAAATIAAFGFMIWLSDIGSNSKNPTP